jgi:hypothetical protein
VDPELIAAAGPEPTRFLGHQELTAGARVLALAGPHGLASELIAGERGLAIFDQTPFYAEGGGQVGDTGQVTAPGMAASVRDTRNADGRHVHVLEVTSGVLQPGDTVELAVDPAGAGRSCGTIRPPTCCTRPCARCSASTSGRPGRWSPRTGCASTSSTPGRCRQAKSTGSKGSLMPRC